MLCPIWPEIFHRVHQAASCKGQGAFLRGIDKPVISLRRPVSLITRITGHEQITGKPKARWSFFPPKLPDPLNTTLLQQATDDGKRHLSQEPFRLYGKNICWPFISQQGIPMLIDGVPALLDLIPFLLESFPTVDSEQTAHRPLIVLHRSTSFLLACYWSAT